jgi:hypothetical protein
MAGEFLDSVDANTKDDSVVSWDYTMPETMGGDKRSRKAVFPRTP